ncbi:ankyrin repeat domain-containing protein [Mucilaginibacter celer]|uniref:Ankyrin repeat domain-containing protein n=1 Tax=Mucilaginibacter celer TaxID=2305508 RepID=A0A494VYW0_9SPHI|nr:ankyrin repeat domain-containing protein [Mucilaginibacter celer]AYL96182.1 ankyrin repeat domain-containing protein [Mucilaginibacter celer]
MAKKKTTLPKDFEELLSTATFQELKDIFNKCDVDARGGYGKQTALAYNSCSHELAKWLVEQGADLHAADTWGNTPLHNRSRSRLGNIESLLLLGADVNYRDNQNNMPIHAAADAHQIESTRLLLAYGSKTDALNSNDNTPLEQALLTCRNIDIKATTEISKLHLKAGVGITTKMKKLVAEIGKQFEFHRANFNKENIAEFDLALDELYKIFGVEPVGKRVLHDGKSQIEIKGKTWQEQHQELWELLVPSNGPAETIQGEIIRVTGRIANELEGNGGINWDADYKKMTDKFIELIKQGKQLPDGELLEAEEIIIQIKQKNGDTARLCELGVKWVIDNPVPVKLSPVDYKR